MDRMRPLLLAVLLGTSLFVAHATETDEVELDQAEAYEASMQPSSDLTDLIQTEEGAEQPAQAQVVAPKDDEVKIIGKTTFLSTVQMRSAKAGNLFTIADQDRGITFATKTGDAHMRIMPTTNTGISINSNTDKVGLYVDHNTGNVGVGHSNPSAKHVLDVKGTTFCKGTVTATASTEKNKPAVKLSGVADYNGIQLGDEGAKTLYLIGRGSATAARELSFHIPDQAAYNGGADPSFSWVAGNGNTQIAQLNAKGNMFVRGRLGVGTIKEDEPKASLDVRGAVHLQGAKGGVITFPKGADGGLYIRQTDEPLTALNDDEGRVHITVAKEGSNEGYVGINTPTSAGKKPKAHLDVRGALHLQDGSGAAVLYFDSSAKGAGFHFRAADNPAEYNAAQERMFIGADGRVGIGTTNPQYGLQIGGADPKTTPANADDVAIMQGDLYLKGSIKDIKNKNYFIKMSGKSVLKSVNTEELVGVGKFTAEEFKLPAGADAALVVQGENPLINVKATKPNGVAKVELQSGSESWTIEHNGGEGKFSLKKGAKSHMTVTADGKIGIGNGAEALNPKYGFVIHSDKGPEKAAENDLSIQAGGLWLGGEIKPIGNAGGYSFSMDKGGLVKSLNVEGNLGIGLRNAKPKFALQIAPQQKFSIGENLFMSGENGVAYVTANSYKSNGQWALHNNKFGGSALSLDKNGVVKISGTKKNGEAAQVDMFKIDAKSQTAVFPAPGMKFGFGTVAPEYPMQVNGVTKSAAGIEASIAFGDKQANMGYLGANSQHVYVATNTGNQEHFTINHENGYVGIGTKKPLSPLHIQGESDATMSFGSRQAPTTHAYIKAKQQGTALNMVFGITNPANGGGKLTFDFKDEIKFSGVGNTVFDRGAGSQTLFKTGQIGIGGTPDSKFKVHVYGDMKVNGKCYVSAKTAAPPPPPAAAPAAEADEDLGEGEGDDALSELDFSDLLEVAEGRTENVHPEHGIDVQETLHGLTRVLRKQRRQMETHDRRIEDLSQQMATLMEAR